MNPEAHDSRKFRRGSWDLRRDERRKMHRDISFPDRRISDRRDDLSGWLKLEEPELTWKQEKGSLY